MSVSKGRGSLDYLNQLMVKTGDSRIQFLSHHFITMHAKGIQLVFFSGLTKEVGVDSYCFPSQIYPPPPPFWLMSHTTFFFYFSCVTFEQLKAQSATMYLFHFIRNILFTRLSHSLAKKYAPL